MCRYHIQTIQALTDDRKRDEAILHVSSHVSRNNTIFFGTENPRIIREHESTSPEVMFSVVLTLSLLVGATGPYFFDTETVVSNS